ncbi:hypothetical protein EW146_g5965 [Bondarzewia mesenterica]|uniref:Uncharacterized protein n=1 Tax=Bondarzewia mesenterica TaxID=1095465 RepID=A0A4S4LQ08_9AGAM|nr:hypothetical protein EW146_g5965 [Bondarzewia mesenterica]
MSADHIRIRHCCKSSSESRESLDDAVDRSRRELQVSAPSMPRSIVRPSPSNLSLSIVLFVSSTMSTSSPSSSLQSQSMAIHSQSNPIDLTLDDDQNDFNPDRLPKRRRVEPSFIPNSLNSHNSIAPLPQPSEYKLQPVSSPDGKFLPQSAPERSFLFPAEARQLHSPAPTFSPAFQNGNYAPQPAYGPSSAIPSAALRPVASTSSTVHSVSNGSREQVIDLTGSPSPPPHPSPTHQAYFSGSQPQLSLSDLPPKTPVCIGQLAVTALVLYPVNYLQYSQANSQGADEWAPVRLQYERNVNKPGKEDTIHIKTLSTRTPNGNSQPGEAFAIVEQKVASSLGPMLGKGLIRLDAKVQRGTSNSHIRPLHVLVYTPKGNIPIVGDYLQQSSLFLDHPDYYADGQQRVGNYPYCNPHNPPPGGFNRSGSVRMGYSGPGGSNIRRWTTPNVMGKSIEVQRSQVDELFKNMRSGDELEETDSRRVPSCECYIAPEIGTKLYPHQKKALTFLLEREQERVSRGGKSSSLWQPRHDPLSGQYSWVHLVTQRVVLKQPAECKGAILADDMGLGKTITCVSLLASTLHSARAFASDGFKQPKPPAPERTSSEPALDAAHFAGSVWGMPSTATHSSLSAKDRARETRAHEQLEVQYSRACRIKLKSRATLVICPLSTVANWEDQFREHWSGEVTIVGGGGSCPTPLSQASRGSSSSLLSTLVASTPESCFTETKKPPSASTPISVAQMVSPLRVYVYHGNARRSDPTFLSDYDVVITTYATLASEFSKQSKSIAPADEEEEDSSESAGEGNSMTIRLGKPKRPAKRKKPSAGIGIEATSPLQSVYWFRVVLDEAHSIKEINTVACRACCDLMADRRLCLTGTPVQNKLDDIFALIKFLRLGPFDDKAIWTEYIGAPVKYGQPLGIARLQSIMKSITLRRTKESKAQNGQHILSLPPRRDELRYLKFDDQEQAVYDHFFQESKEEFNELSNKNEVMKNYVGILQKILRLRQICDHFELVKGKGLPGDTQSQDALSYEDAVAANCCGGYHAGESSTSENPEGGSVDEGPSAPKRGRRPKNTPSRPSSRAQSPSRPPALLILTRCQHLFCGCCYKTRVHPNWPNCPSDLLRPCPVCQSDLLPTDVVEVNPNAVPGDGSAKRKSGRKEKRTKGIALEDFHPSTKVKALMGDLIQFSRMNPHSVNYDPGSMEVQMTDVDGNVVEESPTKSIVLVEDALEASGICYDRLDGTMRRDERSRAMDALKNDPGCEVLLVSLKAGGVGLNLTAAQRVYLMDPYWNPAVENQAVDRIHRLGQTRPVTTVKLIIENSIEARLLEVQKKKTELANMTLGQNFSKAELLQRRLEELNRLFGA